ncbi:MAG: hypothetical protein JWO78_1308 [Micavibrio sp.]|nr:hypothetical protein [Micavibrio sp.]
MMFKFFKKAAEAATPAVPDTATLDTRHGLVSMNRLRLQSGEVAYICHKEERTEDARLHAGHIDYVSIDRNSSEDIDPNCIMSEETPDSGKSDFIYAAEDACNKRQSMEKSVVLVFFDHLKNARNAEIRSANDVIAEIRGHFPADAEGQDTLDRPAPVLRLVSGGRTEKKKTDLPPDFHYTC